MKEDCGGALISNKNCHRVIFLQGVFKPSTLAIIPQLWNEEDDDSQMLITEQRSLLFCPETKSD